ncbi:MAG: outer membrane beta-barrel protein [Cytophagaceae bacterium]
MKYIAQIRTAGFIILFFMSFPLMAQFTFGVKVNAGTSFIKSRNLKKFHKSEKEDYPDLTKINASSRLRTGFGFGGFAEYKYSENLYFTVEPTINFFGGKILINRIYENIDSTGTGTIVRSSSDMTIKTTFISTPILVKYMISPIRKYYVIGGFAVNVNFKPRLISKEQTVIAYHKNHVLDESHVETFNMDMKASKYRPLTFNLIIGAGKNFGRYGRDFNVDIRYYLPLSKSELYTSNSRFTENSFNNYVFTKEGKEYVNAEGYKLNDFRMGMLMVSIGYSIFKK